MAFYSSSNTSNKLHRAGHVFGRLPKRTSQGNGLRKRGSYKNKKRYRGQGR